MRTPTETLKQSTAMERVLQSSFLCDSSSWNYRGREQQQANKAPLVLEKMLLWTILYYNGKEVETSLRPTSKINKCCMWFDYFTLHKCIERFLHFIRDDHWVDTAGSSSIGIHFKSALVQKHMPNFKRQYFFLKYLKKNGVNVSWVLCIVHAYKTAI